MITYVYVYGTSSPLPLLLIFFPPSLSRVFKEVFSGLDYFLLPSLSSSLPPL